MIALIAYGFGSVANAFDLGGNLMVNLIPSNITSFNDQQITQMNDPSFAPMYLTEHAITSSNLTSNTNSTNDTNYSGNQTDNSQNQDNSQNYNQ